MAVFVLICKQNKSDCFQVDSWRQNEDLKYKLLSTGDKLLAEASPYDKIWGIGLSGDEIVAWNTETWKGTNLLGKILMRVRDELN